MLGGYCYCPLTCASLGKNWLRAEVRHLPVPRDHPPQHLEPPAAEEQDLLRKAGSEDLALILVRETDPSLSKLDWEPVHVSAEYPGLLQVGITEPCFSHLLLALG